jgi:hypothetical protein
MHSHQPGGTNFKALDPRASLLNVHYAGLGQKRTRAAQTVMSVKGHKRTSRL